MNNWKNYLPEVLQLQQLYWIVAFNVAAVCFFKKLPITTERPWAIQLCAFALSMIFTWMLLGRAGLVYGFGVSLIASSMAVTFYDVFISWIVLFLSWVTSKIRAFFGSPDPALSIPRPSSPESIINPTDLKDR